MSVAGGDAGSTIPLFPYFSRPRAETHHLSPFLSTCCGSSVVAVMFYDESSDTLRVEGVNSVFSSSWFKTSTHRPRSVESRHPSLDVAHLSALAPLVMVVPFVGATTAVFAEEWGWVWVLAAVGVVFGALFAATLRALHGSVVVVDGGWELGVEGRQEAAQAVEEAKKAARCGREELSCAVEVHDDQGWACLRCILRQHKRCELRVGNRWVEAVEEVEGWNKTEKRWLVTGPEGKKGSGGGGEGGGEGGGGDEKEKEGGGGGDEKEKEGDEKGNRELGERSGGDVIVVVSEPAAGVPLLMVVTLYPMLAGILLSAIAMVVHRFLPIVRLQFAALSTLFLVALPLLSTVALLAIARSVRNWGWVRNCGGREGAGRDGGASYVSSGGAYAPELGDAESGGAGLGDAELGGAELGGAELGGAELGGAESALVLTVFCESRIVLSCLVPASRGREVGRRVLAALTGASWPLGGVVRVGEGSRDGGVERVPLLRARSTWSRCAISESTPPLARSTQHWELELEDKDACGAWVAARVGAASTVAFTAGASCPFDSSLQLSELLYPRLPTVRSSSYAYSSQSSQYANLVDKTRGGDGVSSVLVLHVFMSCAMLVVFAIIVAQIVAYQSPHLDPDVKPLLQLLPVLMAVLGLLGLAFFAVAATVPASWRLTPWTWWISACWRGAAETEEEESRLTHAHILLGHPPNGLIHITAPLVGVDTSAYQEIVCGQSKESSLPLPLEEQDTSGLCTLHASQHSLQVTSTTLSAHQPLAVVAFFYAHDAPFLFGTSELFQVFPSFFVVFISMFALFPTPLRWTAYVAPVLIVLFVCANRCSRRSLVSASSLPTVALPTPPLAVLENLKRSWRRRGAKEEEGAGGAGAGGEGGGGGGGASGFQSDAAEAGQVYDEESAGEGEGEKGEGDGGGGGGGGGGSGGGGIFPKRVVECESEFGIHLPWNLSLLSSNRLELEENVAVSTIEGAWGKPSHRWAMQLPVAPGAKVVVKGVEQQFSFPGSFMYFLMVWMAVPFLISLFGNADDVLTWIPFWLVLTGGVAFTLFFVHTLQANKSRRRVQPTGASTQDADTSLLQVKVDGLVRLQAQVPSAQLQTIARDLLARCTGRPSLPTHRPLCAVSASKIDIFREGEKGGERGGERGGESGVGEGDDLWGEEREGEVVGEVGMGSVGRESSRAALHNPSTRTLLYSHHWEFKHTSSEESLFHGGTLPPTCSHVVSNGGSMTGPCSSLFVPVLLGWALVIAGCALVGFGSSWIWQVGGCILSIAPILAVPALAPLARRAKDAAAAKYSDRGPPSMLTVVPSSPFSSPTPLLFIKLPPLPDDTQDHTGTLKDLLHVLRHRTTPG